MYHLSSVAICCLILILGRIQIQHVELGLAIAKVILNDAGIQGWNQTVCLHHGLCI